MLMLHVAFAAAMPLILLLLIFMRVLFRRAPATPFHFSPRHISLSSSLLMLPQLLRQLIRYYATP